MTGLANGSPGTHGCEDPGVAAARAGEMVAAVTASPGADFWQAMASPCLAAYLRAAALAGGDMHQVALWVAGQEPDQPEQILASAGGLQQAARLSELRHRHMTAQSVRLVMCTAVAYAS
jgi:hypothetical protein